MKRAAAFTLIELLAVIAIICILAALIVGASRYAWQKAATSRAQSEIAAMENALENYKNDNGAYPFSTINRSDFSDNNTNLYSSLAGGSKIYFNFQSSQLSVQAGGTATNVLDPFGKPYNYFNPPPGSTDIKNNQATFDLWSYGPSGTDGAPDEIANWKQQ